MVCGADVRRGDDLDEWRSAAVEVDERIVGATDSARPTPDVHCLGRILLEVSAHDPDHTVAICSWKYYFPINARW